MPMVVTTGKLVMNCNAASWLLVLHLRPYPGAKLQTPQESLVGTIQISQRRRIRCLSGAPKRMKVGL